MSGVRSDAWDPGSSCTYERVSVGSFPDTLESVRRAIRERELVVHRVYDIQAALQSKGFPIQPLTIFEVGGSDEQGLADLVGLLTPLRINVYEREGRVMVAALRPTFVTRIVTDTEVERLVERLDADVVAVVDDSVGGS